MWDTWKESYARAKREFKDPCAGKNYGNGTDTLEPPYFIWFFLICLGLLLAKLHLIIFLCIGIRKLRNLEFRKLDDYENVCDLFTHVTTGYFNKEIDFITFLHLLAPF